ncbi:outer membrane protein [Bradyrhizobium sp. WD16]|uniref:outer membrane protein n=1 Tax=Bradyrhizobium sp. WD16 TaxID=1521768 RepID=UPI0020A2B173|nr:outer membrane beta-barrel protein [Bradyrhizobium sp. WD16]UTD25868.1 porin family protein [Bradyrhizobium sp. WD16]
MARRIGAALVGAALGLIATALPEPARAADLAPLYKAPAGRVPVAVKDTWTGGYIGFFAGGAAAASDASTSVPASAAGTPFFGGRAASYGLGASAIAGLTTGYNLQVAPHWVIGLESETGYLRLKGSNGFDGRPTTTGTMQIGATYSLWSGRVGYAFDKSLLYAKGGVALAQVDGGASDPTPGLHTDAIGHELEIGYAVGGGLEYMIGPRWSLKAEYLYLGLPKDLTTTGNGQPLPTQLFTTTTVPGIHSAKVGVNYQWDWLSLFKR